MTFEDVLIRLIRHYGKPMEPEVVNEFERVLGAWPVELLNKAVDRAIENRDFMPSVSELLRDVRSVHGTDAEWAYAKVEPCERCVDQPGWITVKDERGYERLQKCACRTVALGGHPKPAINRHLKTGHFLMAVDRDVDRDAELVLQRRHGERLGEKSSAAGRCARSPWLVAAPH